jgi:Ni/Co efflux regulator RcnB
MASGMKRRPTMKRLALITVALLTAATPLAAAPAFADQGRGHYARNDHRDHRDDRRVVVVKKHVWHKGDRIRHDNHRFHEIDYHPYRYSAPPRGFHYVRDSNTGEILLVAIATGLIASIILGN